MPAFDYIASNARGESIRGTAQAADRADLLRQLQQLNLFLVSCRTLESAQGGVPAAEIRAPISTSPAPVGRLKIREKELAALTRQIAISVNAGVPFVGTLQRIAQRSRQPQIARVVAGVLNDVLAGQKFSEALSRYPSVFSPLYVSMVAAGETGGFLPKALNRMADSIEQDVELGAKIRSALMYPAAIAIVATFVVTGIMLFVIPTFVKVFDEMGVALPLPTRLLISTSQFFRHGGFLLPLSVWAGYVGFSALRRRNESVRRYSDAEALRLPIFGRLILLESLTGFMRGLSSLVANGVMALQALSVAKQVVDNRAIESVVEEIIMSVQQGNGLSPVLYKSRLFPELVADMVATGESTGTLPEVLDKTAEYYENEVAATIRDVLTMIEPVMIMVMALMVGVIIAGLMLPLFGISHGIGG